MLSGIYMCVRAHDFVCMCACVHVCVAGSLVHQFNGVLPKIAEGWNAPGSIGGRSQSGVKLCRRTPPAAPNCHSRIPYVTGTDHHLGHTGCDLYHMRGWQDDVHRDCTHCHPCISAVPQG